MKTTTIRLDVVSFVTAFVFMLAMLVCLTHAFADEATPISSKAVEVNEQSLNGALARIDIVVSSITGVLRGGQERGLTRDEVDGLRNDIRLINAAVTEFIREQKEGAQQKSASETKPPVVETPAPVEAAPKS